MNTEMRVDRVIEIRRGSEQDILQILTDRSGQLWLDTKELEKTDIECLSASMAQKQPIAIEFTEQTRKIVWVNYATVDRILALSDPGGSGQEVLVHAMKRPSLLALRKDDPRFTELYELLAKALAEGEKGVKAALATSGKYIRDVILIELPPKN